MHIANPFVVGGYFLGEKNRFKSACVKNYAILSYFSFANVNTNSSPPPWLFFAEILPP